MAFTKLFVAAVAALSVVSAAPVGWSTKTWESYDVYHARYNALDCKHKHNTTFFTKCCGPLHAGHSLSERPAMCAPSSNSTSTITATATATSSTATVTVTSTVSAVEDDVTCDDGSDDDTEDDDEECPEGTEPVDDDGDDDDSDDDGTGTTTLNPTTTTTSSVAAATTTKAATTTTSKTSTATTKKATSTSSSSGASHTGQATYYTQGGAAGACGDKHSDSDLIGAMNYQLYGSSSKVSSICGKKVKITNTDNNKSVTITIADDCPSCPGKGDIDLSVAAFEALGKKSTGVLPIVWNYV